MGKKRPDPHRFDVPELDDSVTDEMIKKGYTYLNNSTLSVHIHNRFRLVLRRLRRETPLSKNYLKNYKHLIKLIENQSSNQTEGTKHE